MFKVTNNKSGEKKAFEKIYDAVHYMLTTFKYYEGDDNELTYNDFLDDHVRHCEEAMIDPWKAEEFLDNLLVDDMTYVLEALENSEYESRIQIFTVKHEVA